MTVKSHFENVYIYVADALRYDFVPPHVHERFDVHRTVAGGTLSPPGFATLITGRYPIEHGVFNFSDRLQSGSQTLFNSFSGLNTGFYRGGGEVGNTLGKEYDRPNDPFEPDAPFLVMERDLLTHAPYAHSQSALLPRQHQRYFTSVAKGRTNVVQDYRKAAELTFERFEQRLETLRERGILEETLVILTSDHGEFLGEYGLIGHGHSITPEVAYVPTVIYSPGLNINQNVIGHTDLFNIIGKALGQEDNVPKNILNSVNKSVSDEEIYLCYSRSPDTDSVWGPNGGYVFTRDGILSRVKWTVGKLGFSTGKDFHMRNFSSVVKHGFSGTIGGPIKYGNPQFDVSTAESLLKSATDGQQERAKRELTEEAKERLKDLGYVEQARNNDT